MALVVAVGAAASCTARQPPDAMAVTEDGGPEQVVERHLLALIGKDWETSASLTRPDELAQNRQSIQPLLLADTTGILSRRIVGRSRAELNELTDVEFNAAMWAFQVSLTAQGTALDRFTGVEIVGTARPAPDTAFVVYRWVLPADERPIRSANVAKVVRVSGRWYLDMLADFTGLREMITR